MVSQAHETLRRGDLLKGVKSSPFTMTNSGQTFFASRIDPNFFTPLARAA